MKKNLFFSILWMLVFTQFSFAQSDFPYEIVLNPVSVPNLPNLHSYAYAQHQGKWLIIGGRKDGLHPRQPFNSFPASQNNTNIYVVDVSNRQVWSASVDVLPTNLKEQLQSTNMNFYQDTDTLYIIGGYGFSASQNKHITYPYLTSVQVSSLINAITNGANITPYFKQIQNDIFAVTGGHLKKLKNYFYLVGGHRFDGRYNPMGNPTFTQTYTNQIRKFTINNSGSQLSFGNYSEIYDEVHLHRRDYNLLPQIFPNGEQGFTISSGVFQINADLPFLYPVDIKESGYTPITDFNQYLSHYHSAVACLYDSLNNNMHSVFFGGMSQYYYQNGSLVQDNLVPFVKTISRLTRDKNGKLTEYKLSTEMPTLQGASAEFIPNLNLPHYSNKVIKLSEINQERFLIGHIFGGILSTALNPFSSNQTNLTAADNSIYEVWLQKISPSAISEMIVNGKNPYDIEILPNPFRNTFKIKFYTDKPVRMSYILSNSLGQVVFESEEKRYNMGENQVNVRVSKQVAQGLLYITAIFDDKHYVTRKIIHN
ncbi:hypothetical protein [Raineya sp.]|jgi:hypothetical protein